MSGFQGLAIARFGGDVEAARAYVADLGRAAFYYKTRQQHAIHKLAPYQPYIPELFYTDLWGQVIDIKWKSPWLAQHSRAAF